MLFTVLELRLVEDIEVANLNSLIGCSSGVQDNVYEVLQDYIVKCLTECFAFDDTVDSHYSSYSNWPEQKYVVVEECIFVQASQVYETCSIDFPRKARRFRKLAFSHPALVFHKRK